ncbi:MAG: sulfatase [Paracoccaceae bacterium]|nr:sulfatase [Paracoccaceae bacterium]
MTKRPNILFILCDDHAARAISAYGGGLNSTPNIDRIAQEGLRLDRCYVTNSICTPSRASILTGTHNHVNGVTTLDTHIDNRLPNVAKHLRAAGYRTGIFGKWHLGEGKAHEPTGFDEWAVLPGQGEYFDPVFINPQGRRRIHGYATDLITDMSLDFMARKDDRPFFLMCHHKAPHRNFTPHPRHRHLYSDPLPLPETFHDSYAGRAGAAEAAKMRVRSDMTYDDLGLVQPEGGREVGEPMFDGCPLRKVPEVEPGRPVSVIDAATGERLTFDDPVTFAEFKYQRYMQRYLRTIQAIDDGVGRLLDWLDESGEAQNTLVIYTSDQGFFLGEHGWFDKRFMYEESLQMPFLVRHPASIRPGMRSQHIAMNVDFAPTFLDYAGVRTPSYMQGTSLRPLFEGRAGADWQDVAYHRYWMNRDDIHNAYAHYGIRDARWKLIYWYDRGLGIEGANEGEGVGEWELFDCDADPHELTNLAADRAHAEAFRRMLARLDAMMAEIGDIPEHDSAAALAALAA